MASIIGGSPSPVAVVSILLVVVIGDADLIPPPRFDNYMLVQRSFLSSRPQPHFYVFLLMDSCLDAYILLTDSYIFLVDS